MRRIMIFLLLLCLAGAVFILPAAAEVPALETPAPMREHATPAPTEVPPLVITRQLSPDLYGSFRFKKDAKFFDIWFANIRNADEAILMYDGEVWLIDVGDERTASNTLALMRTLGISEIAKVFNSHPHHDHIDGLQITHESVPVGELWVCFPEDSTDSMIRAMNYAQTAKIPVLHFENGDSFSMGDGAVTLTFFCPDNEALDMNSNSALTLVQYGERRILFAADMEETGQQDIMEHHSAEEIRAEILKYPHHGKKALYEPFFQAVRPSLAIITNTYTDWGGVRYLDEKKVPTLVTDPFDQYLHLKTDGTNWLVEYVPMSVTP